MRAIPKLRVIQVEEVLSYLITNNNPVTVFSEGEWNDTLQVAYWDGAILIEVGATGKPQRAFRREDK